MDRLRRDRAAGRRIQHRSFNDAWTRAGLDEVLAPGMPKAEFVPRYTFSHPHVHRVIIGTCNRAHLAENVAAADPFSGRVV